ncbi:hypothetical protein [Dictyobacter formicarum]|uniref:hypothetical protein n=1 Tax=Dictyobacter formicarum TaxID=2778368 RepID=UPI001915CD34|nr:hypothetical protein [Dictyobacter formicarum]
MAAKSSQKRGFIKIIYNELPTVRWQLIINNFERRKHELSGVEGTMHMLLYQREGEEDNWNILPKMEREDAPRWIHYLYYPRKAVFPY